MIAWRAAAFILYDAGTSASSTLRSGVTALARVRETRVLANADTPNLSRSAALGLVAEGVERDLIFREIASWQAARNAATTLVNAMNVGCDVVSKKERGGEEIPVQRQHRLGQRQATDHPLHKLFTLERTVIDRRLGTENLVTPGRKVCSM